MFFLVTKESCSKHVEDTKTRIKTFKKLVFCWLRYIIISQCTVQKNINNLPSVLFNGCRVVGRRDSGEKVELFIRGGLILRRTNHRLQHLDVRSHTSIADAAWLGAVLIFCGKCQRRWL